MFMSVDVNYELEQFNTACDDFLKGKYILADLKISGIMKSIAYSEKIKNIISKCLENFDIGKELGNVFNNENVVVMPSESKKIVAVCFNILYNIDNKEINFFDFLNTYFKDGNELGNREFEEFSKVIILPFKKAINKFYTNTHILTESKEYQDNIYNKIARVAQIELHNLDNYKLKTIYKEELQILIESFVTASNNNDKQYVFSLMIALDYFCQIHKKCKPIFEEMQNCFKPQ